MSALRFHGFLTCKSSSCVHAPSTLALGQQSRARALEMPGLTPGLPGPLALWKALLYLWGFGFGEQR